MKRIIDLVVYRVLAPVLFLLLWNRVYKTQVIVTNEIIKYNRSLIGAVI